MRSPTAYEWPLTSIRLSDDEEDTFGSGIEEEDEEEEEEDEEEEAGARAAIYAHTTPQSVQPTHPTPSKHTTTYFLIQLVLGTLRL